MSASTQSPSATPAVELVEAPLQAPLPPATAYVPNVDGVETADLGEPTVATLVLKDGTSYQGYSFGADTHSVAGECVFQTGMVGYPESLTDPSYRGQILVLTYPLIGNYGVPSREAVEEWLGDIPAYFEANEIHVAALIVGQYSHHHSHYLSQSSLSQWLVEQGIPAIYGVDTRALTKKIRQQGVMLGKLLFPRSDGTSAAVDSDAPQWLQQLHDLPWSDPNATNLVAQVSHKQPTLYTPRPGARNLHVRPDGKPLRILAVDVGMKFNQIRCFVKRGVELKVVPWDYDFTADTDYDGLFISNGPGDPTSVQTTIDRLREVMAAERVPIFGICLGHQLLALAAGAKSMKMKYGNRGQNIPCTDMRSGQCLITSQNHGYAVDATTLPETFFERFVNANDGSNEGIQHRTLPYFSVQFHPESAPGPRDTEYLFDVFIGAVYRSTVEGQLAKLVFPIEYDSYETYLRRLRRANKDLSGGVIRKVLILGSGGLSIGQAGEFDYSGSQAIKALKEEHIYTILINPNIATIQTSKGMADKCYFLPVTPDSVRKVIEHEKPDGIYVTFGGQTALNVGIKLKDEFNALRVKVLGTPIETIITTEDRELFAKSMDQINEKCAKSRTATTVAEAIEASQEIGFPVIVRAAYALGGLGSGFAETEAELSALCQKAFAASPQVLIEKSMKGWKEIEYEVVRDTYDNCITVCNMENFDPLGIHTGDSIVVAPSQTLSDQDYHMLRTTAINVVRHLGVVGECNIQYALNPDSKEYCIIEVNARLSRSSALASKATGYPLAFVASKLGLGIPLNEIRNSVTRVTTACFEPSLDYVVVKIPRWDLKKFSRVNTNLSSSMKSVGEVMAIGRTFEETIQKAIRAVDFSFPGFTQTDLVTDIDEELVNPSDQRLFAIANALHRGYSVEHIWKLSKIDRWFLNKLLNIVRLEKHLAQFNQSTVTATLMRSAKQMGFSDRMVARCLESNEMAIRKLRCDMGVTPFVKQIDTVAAEFPAFTNYLYMTYNASEHDVDFADQGVMVLGSGVYRIGSSVEFDWCAVRAIRTLRDNNMKTVMVNYNPETVSTDYDEVDRLYFENITLERALDIYDIERSSGVMISMGGQIPNNIALPLHRQNVRIMGTSPEMIDTAENRYKFSRLLDKLGVDQPSWKELSSFADAQKFCDKVGYPVLVRPSYVLSGAAMNVVFSPDDLASYLNEATAVSREHPVVITKYIEEAKEIEMDAVALDGELIMHVISEHVENAGVHSGDATLILPPQDLDPETVSKVEAATRKIANALNVTGPFNIQFIAKNNEIKVIECNVRAARSFPFVSKVKGVDLIEMATKAMLGVPVEPYPKSTNTPPSALPGAEAGPVVGIKVPQFSFSRLLGADPILGVEMASTGEVACMGRNKYEAYIKALLSTGFQLPKRNILLSIGSYKEKEELLPAVRSLRDRGFNIFATAGTADFMQQHGIPVKYLVTLDSQSGVGSNGNGGSNGGSSGGGNGPTATPGHVTPKGQGQALAADQLKHEYDLEQHLANNLIDLYINLPSKNRFRRPANYVSKGYRTRRMAVDFSVPLITNIKCAKLFIEALTYWRGLKVSSVDYISSHPSIVLPGLININNAMSAFTKTLKSQYLNLTTSAVASGITTLCINPVTTDECITSPSRLKDLQRAVSDFTMCDMVVATVATQTNLDQLKSIQNESPLLYLSFRDDSLIPKAEIPTVAPQFFQHWNPKGLIMTDAEGTDLASVLLLASLYNRPIHVTNVRTKRDITLIALSKQRGMKVTCDAPYLALFVEDLLKARNNNKMMVGDKTLPPDVAAGVSLEDCASLWEHLSYIDCISSGDAVRQICTEASRDFIAGFGLEDMVACLLTAVSERRMTVDDLRQRLYDNPRRILGIPEQPDTYIELELDRLSTVSPTGFRHSPAAWSPIAGREIRGVVNRVVLHGKLVYLDGNIFINNIQGEDLTDSVSPALAHDRSALGSVLTVDTTPKAVSGKSALPTTPRTTTAAADSSITKSTTRARRASLVVDSPTLEPAARHLGTVETLDGLAVAASGDGREGGPRHAQMQLIESLPRSISRIGVHSPFYRKHILSVRQFTRDELHILFGVAQEMRTMVERHGMINLLPGLIMCSMFFEPSTRTQCSFTTAMQRLGGSVVTADAMSSSMAKGESLADTIKTFGAYGNVVVLRHPEPGSVHMAAKYSPLPIINGGDGTGEHPTQAFLDVFTIREELGTVNGLTITLVGDLKNGRTAHSLVRVLAQYHVTLNYVSPSSLRMPDDVKADVAKLGIQQAEYEDLHSVIGSTDVLYVTRVQRERFADLAEYERLKDSYVINNAVLSHAKSNMIVMHPLPRVGEIDPEVDFDPRAAYFRQMKYGMYVRMALLALVLGKSV